MAHVRPIPPTGGRPMVPRFALRLLPLARSVERAERAPPRPFLTRAALRERSPGDLLHNMAAVLLDRLEADGSCLLDDLAAAGYSAEEIATRGAEAERIARVAYDVPRRRPRYVTFAPTFDDEVAS